MTKHYILTLFLLILLNDLPLLAQKKNYIGINGTISWGSPFSQLFEMGGPEYQNTCGISFGIKYSLKVSSHIDLETGIYYLQNNLTIVSNYDPQNISTENETIAFLFFPFDMKYNFKKNFFVKGGMDISMDYSENKHPSINNLSGIGFDIGFGKQISIGKNFILELLPQYRIFNLIPFKQQPSHDKYSDLGFSIIINYNF